MGSTKQQRTVIQNKAQENLEGRLEGRNDRISSPVRSFSKRKTCKVGIRVMGGGWGTKGVVLVHGDGGRIVGVCCCWMD
jgi:hypothetical protein